MTARHRALVELGLACAALAGAAVGWSRSRQMVRVAPVADSQPVTTSLVYNPHLLLLTLILLTAAGVLAVVSVARLRCSRPARPSS